MWFWVTIDADIRCEHKLGMVAPIAPEGLVFVEGRPVQSNGDPSGRPIGGCPNVGVGIKPCTKTEMVVRGKSSFVFVLGKPVIRADLEGLTDGTPQGVVRYTVESPGQTLVSEAP